MEKGNLVGSAELAMMAPSSLARLVTVDRRGGDSRGSSSAVGVVVRNAYPPKKEEKKVGFLARFGPAGRVCRCEPSIHYFGVPVLRNVASGGAEQAKWNLERLGRIDEISRTAPHCSLPDHRTSFRPCKKWTAVECRAPILRRYAPLHLFSLLRLKLIQAFEASAPHMLLECECYAPH